LDDFTAARRRLPAGPLPLAVALALDDHLVRVVRQSVERTLRHDPMVEQRYPLFEAPVAGGSFVN
jgi:hypothetical protein